MSTDPDVDVEEEHAGDHSQTGGEVRVIDEGGVFSPSEQLRFGTTVTVEVEAMGKLTDSQLHSIIAGDLPAGAQLELTVGLSRR